MISCHDPVMILSCLCHALVMILSMAVMSCRAQVKGCNMGCIMNKEGPDLFNWPLHTMVVKTRPQPRVAMSPCLILVGVA